MSEFPHLTHLDQSGAAAMVDVSNKQDTKRLARAGAVVFTTPEVISLIEQALLKKGDVLATARIAKRPNRRRDGSINCRQCGSANHLRYV